MNADKLKRLQSQVRIGGKGTPRRKKKIVHQTAATDDKKLQSSLKKLSVNTIPGIEEVNMIKNDGTVLHFNNPKAQASLVYKIKLNYKFIYSLYHHIFIIIYYFS